MIAHPLNWTEHTRLALVVKAVASELGASEGLVRERVELLRAVLPDGGLEGNFPDAKVADLVGKVRLAMDVDGVVSNLLVLREEFPTANVSRIATKNTNLLRTNKDDLRRNAQEAKRALLEQGGDDPDGLVQEAPLLLEPGAMAGVLGELRRLFGSKTPPGRLLQNAPDLALSCQSLQSQSRGDRDRDYLRDIFSGGSGVMLGGSSSGDGGRSEAGSGAS